MISNQTHTSDTTKLAETKHHKFHVKDPGSALTHFIAMIGAVIAAIIAGYFAHSAGRSYERKQYDSKVGSAEEKAREIIDEALKTA